MNFERLAPEQSNENEEDWLAEMSTWLSDDERQEIEDLWPKMSPSERRQAFESFKKSRH